MLGFLLGSLAFFHKGRQTVWALSRKIERGEKKGLTIFPEMTTCLRCLSCHEYDDMLSLVL
jgi:hypothetical protein